jgi:hypothetical protein
MTSQTVASGGWWHETSIATPKPSRHELNGVIIYIMWNIWKERNRRIFEHSSLNADEVAFYTVEDINQRRSALFVAP